MTESVSGIERPIFAGVGARIWAYRRYFLPVFMVYAVLACVAPAMLPALVVHDASQYGHWTYAAGQNQLTWFNTGFARRELQGTIQAFLSADPMIATAEFHLLTFPALAAVVIWLLARRGVSLQAFAIGAVSTAVLVRVGWDVGRSDPIVMLLGLSALWAVRNGRWAVAAAALGVSLTFHESGLIFLGPLCAAAAWESGSWRNWRSRSAALGAVVLGLALLAYLISARTQLDPVALDAQIHSKFPNPVMPDIAVYWNASGVRGLKVAQCVAAMDPNYWINVASGCALLTFAAVTLRPQRWRSTLAATMLPYLALDCIAIDVGRWAVFGVFGIAALALADPEPMQPRRGTITALLILPLMVMPIAWRWFAAPVPLVDFTMQNVSYQTLGPVPQMYECDPNWRRYLGLGHD
jgi:hypothetical protein